ncbi:MAG: tetratricopeptide repeat protein [Candidatus Eremiobacteraeota bacterium]|nr:tetratricopeptide repeat protein [Candidatus Eremiobacteraeota bacterium]
MPDIHRPVLAVVGHIVEADDPEFRSLELAQRFFERKANQRGADEQGIVYALIWLAGTRVVLHNVKGALHTLGHLRARSRGRFKELETMAGYLEIRLALEMREYKKALGLLERLTVDSDDERTRARLSAIAQMYRGRILSAQGQIQLGHVEFEKALASLRVGSAQLEDLAITAEIYNEQGHSFYREGKVDEGMKAYTQAETVAGHIGFKLALARSLRGRGIIHSIRKENEQAIKLLRQALDVYQGFDAPYGVLRTCISLGRSHYALADYRQALFYFEEARVQCGKGRYPNEEAEVNARIGDIMLAEGRYDEAAEFYEQDLQIVTVQGTDRARSHALRNVGRIQRLLGNFLRAEACLEESYQIFKRLDDRPGLVQTLQQMVQCFLEEGKTVMARRALDALKDQAVHLGRTHEVGIANMLEGLVLRHEDKSAEARLQLEKSLRVFAEDPGFYTVMCRMELGQALHDLGHRESALHQFKEAIQTSRKLRLHDMEKRALDLLAKIDRSEWARILHGGGTQPMKDRRVNRVYLSILMLELRGLDTIWDLEPEPQVQTLNQVYDALASIIHQEKGILGKLSGERMQVIFGLESTCDPGLALACGEACLEGFQRQRRELELPAEFGLAASIATGEAVEGMLGPSDRLEFGVFGEAVSLAKVILGAAAPGEVVVCPHTYRALSHNLPMSAPRDLEAPDWEKLVVYQVSSGRTLTHQGGLAVDGGLAG